MKKIAGFNFPETSEELDVWVPQTSYRALSSRVLAVFTTRCEGAWSVYIDAVPGKRHSDEWQEVLERGVKASREVARALFDVPTELPYVSY